MLVQRDIQDSFGKLIVAIKSNRYEFLSKVFSVNTGKCFESFFFCWKFDEDSDLSWPQIIDPVLNITKKFTLCPNLFLNTFF